MRAAAHNLGWLVAEKAARLVLNVGVGFWVARYLGPARFGTLNYVLALVGIASLLAELGLDAIVRRRLIHAPDEATAVLATAWGLRLAGGVLAYGGLVAGSVFGGVTSEERALLAVAGLTLFQPALMVCDVWFQARLRARFSVGAQLAALAVGAMGRVVLIVNRAPLVGFVWVAVAELAIAALLLFVLARRDGLRWRAGAWEARLAGAMLREAWPLLLSGFAVMLYTRIDAVMLRSMAGEAAVGMYVAATRFTELGYFLPMALATSLLPALLRARERGAADYTRRLQGYYDLNAGLAYLVAVPLALAAPGLITLAYGGAFAGAAPILAVHVWSSVFVFLGVARGQFLINEGHTGFYLMATTAGLVANVALNLVLIPRDGAMGAAIATVAGQAVAAWISSFCFAPTRPNGWMQTRALFIPVRWISYVRRP